MSDVSGRRLGDKVLAAFNQACDQSDAEIAELLLRTLELLLTREGGANTEEKRADLGAVIDAYSRLLAIKSAG